MLAKILVSAALWLVRRAGLPAPAVELRVIRLNEDRPGVVGRKLGEYQSIRAGRAALARHTAKPGTLLTLGLRWTLGEKLGTLAIAHPANSESLTFDKRPAKAEMPPIKVDWDSVARSNGRHVCNHDGALIPVNGEYHTSCSICGEAQ